MGRGVSDAELERRKAVCRDCPDLATRGGIAFCKRACHRDDGKYCEPWAANQYRKLMMEPDGCPQWSPLTVAEPTSVSLPPITATVTMCRRLPLMCQTMDSLLANLTDHSHIQRWIAMDDGSESSDLYELAQRYPFLEIAVADMKGHAAALNQLFAMVDTDFIFHLEDDWRFETAGPLLHHCWTVMQHDPRIGVACLRGFHFGDVPAADGISYGLHAYGPGSPWPGYSLNPGLQDLRKVRQAGPFLAEPDFERKYARRFRDAGYELAHLNPPPGRRWIKHIGGGKSAYAANKTAR